MPNNKQKPNKSYNKNKKQKSKLNKSVKESEQERKQESELTKSVKENKQECELSTFIQKCKQEREQELKKENDLIKSIQKKTSVTDVKVDEFDIAVSNNTSDLIIRQSVLDKKEIEIFESFNEIEKNNDEKEEFLTTNINVSVNSLQENKVEEKVLTTENTNNSYNITQEKNDYNSIEGVKELSKYIDYFESVDYNQSHFYSCYYTLEEVGGVLMCVYKKETLIKKTMFDYLEIDIKVEKFILIRVTFKRQITKKWPEPSNDTGIIYSEKTTKQADKKIFILMRNPKESLFLIKSEMAKKYEDATIHVIINSMVE